MRPLDEAGQRLLNRSRVVGFATPEAEQAIKPRDAAGALPRPTVESLATGVANLLEGCGLRRLPGLTVVEAIAVVLLGLAGPMVLPHVGAIWGTILAVGLADERVRRVR